MVPWYMARVVLGLESIVALLIFEFAIFFGMLTGAVERLLARVTAGVWVDQS